MRCRFCGEPKELSDFIKSRLGEYRVNKPCLKCCRERTRKWRAANPDRVREINNKWFSAHPNKVNNSRLRWKAKNPDKAREYDRKRSAKNPDRSRESIRKWKAANPERLREYVKVRSARKRSNGVGYTAPEWRSLKEFYNYTCLRCKRQEPEIKLTPDHVIPLAQGGSNLIDNIQPLCLSCNCSKGAKHIDYR